MCIWCRYAAFRPYVGPMPLSTRVCVSVCVFVQPPTSHQFSISRNHIRKTGPDPTVAGANGQAERQLTSHHHIIILL